MAASFFTEDYRLGTVSGSAGSYERRHEEEEGREEVTRFPGIVVGSASEVEFFAIGSAHPAWGHSCRRSSLSLVCFSACNKIVQRTRQAHSARLNPTNWPKRKDATRRPRLLFLKFYPIFSV